MNADERTMTNVNENENVNMDVNVSENANECKEPKKGGSKWKHVAIGGAAGIMMGAAGTFVGIEGAEAAEVAESNIDIEPVVDEPTPDVNVPVATSVNDEMSFGEAFAAARAEVGAGGVFEWHGNIYNTYYAEEWEAMTPEEREDFYEAAIHSSNEDVPADVLSDTMDVPEVTAAPIATSVNDDMSFNEAFAAARAEVGAGGVFEWHGNTYNTYYAEEWDAMSPAERETFYASVADIDTADNVSTVANVDVVDETSTDDDVHVIGIYEENIDGQDVYIGAMEIDGNNVMLVDVDHDGVFDIAVADINADGEISENEVEDISDCGIGVEDMAVRAYMDNTNELLAADDMPDYMNDADVSMC